MTLYYSKDNIHIYVGDILDSAHHIPSMGSGPNLTIIDPPYNAGKAYDQHNDSLPDADYAQWVASWWFQLRDQVDGRFVVFPGHGNLALWLTLDKPSSIGCWFKPGNPASSHLGWCEWEPWLYWGTRVGGSDTIRATITKQQGVGDHPCPKPLTLYEALIKKFKPGLVFDPMMGSGTALVAAKKAGIPAVGQEISPHYADIAISRLEAL